MFVKKYFFLIFLFAWQVSKSVISLLAYYSWKKFTIIYEEEWKNVGESLKVQAELKNMTVNHIREFKDNSMCCEKNLLCCRGGFNWYQV